jgi:hypothetical protein
MLPIGLGVSQWINRAMAEALKRMRLKPFAFPNRMSQPGGGGTMGLQEGSPHVPKQPLAPPVAEPELPQLSLQAPPVESQEQQQREPDWRAYFHEYVKLLRRQAIPLPSFQPPLAPTQTDWQRTLPALIGMLFAPGGFRQGFLQGLTARFQQEQEAQARYAEAMRDFANQQAQLAFQQAQQEALGEQQAQEQALKLSLSTMSDEQKRELQRQIEALRNATRLDIERMQNDMQAVSRHMAIANNPNLPAQQRAGAYQNAAAILSRYGYDLPPVPVEPSVQERAQQLREQIEPQKMSLEEKRFDLARWRAQEHVKQGWERIATQKTQVGVSLQRLGLAVQRGQQQQVSQQLRALQNTHQALVREEQALMRQLNATSRDELGRPVPVYNIPLQRQRDLLSGATPQNATEAQWQDIALRLGEVRQLKQQTLPVLLAATVPGVKPNAPKAGTPAAPDRRGTPAKEVRLPDGTIIREMR